MKGEEKVRENSSRLVYFEDWMDTNAAHKVLEKADDIQVERLRYSNDRAYNDAAMARAHGYQVQSRTELIEPWFPDSELLLRAPNLVAVSSTGAGYDYIDVRLFKIIPPAEFVSIKNVMKFENPSNDEANVMIENKYNPIVTSFPS